MSSARTPDGNMSGTYALPANARRCPPFVRLSPGCSIVSGLRPMRRPARRLGRVRQTARSSSPRTCRRSGMPGTVPRYRKYLPRGRDVFPHHRSRWPLESRAPCKSLLAVMVPRALHMNLVRLDRRHISTQRSPDRERSNQDHSNGARFLPPGPIDLIEPGCSLEHGLTSLYLAG